MKTLFFKKMQKSEKAEKIHATAQQAISKTYDISLENRDFMQHAASNTLLKKAKKLRRCNYASGLLKDG